jgi:hypothetical protein
MGSELKRAICSSVDRADPRSDPVDVLTAIILLSPCFVVFVLVFFFLAMRYIAYRERIELAERGFLTPEESFWERIGQRSPRGVLWAGVITAMSGLALLLGLATIGIGVWLLGGLIPLFVGAGMVLIYFVGGSAGGRGGRQEPEEVADVESGE